MRRRDADARTRAALARPARRRRFRRRLYSVRRVAAPRRRRRGPPASTTARSIPRRAIRRAARTPCDPSFVVYGKREPSSDCGDPLRSGASANTHEPEPASSGARAPAARSASRAPRSGGACRRSTAENRSTAATSTASKSPRCSASPRRSNARRCAGARGAPCVDARVRVGGRNRGRRLDDERVPARQRAERRHAFAGAFHQRRRSGEKKRNVGTQRARDLQPIERPAGARMRRASRRVARPQRRWILRRARLAPECVCAVRSNRRRAPSARSARTTRLSSPPRSARSHEKAKRSSVRSSVRRPSRAGP